MQPSVLIPLPPPPGLSPFAIEPGDVLSTKRDQSPYRDGLCYGDRQRRPEPNAVTF